MSDIKTVELTDEQISLIISVLKEKRDDLDVVLKNSDGLELDTIQDLQLERRDINSVMTELQFYAIMK